MVGRGSEGVYHCLSHDTTISSSPALSPERHLSPSVIMAEDSTIKVIENVIVLEVNNILQGWPAYVINFTAQGAGPHIGIYMLVLFILTHVIENCSSSEGPFQVR